MTIKELIKELKKLDQKSKIVIVDNDGIKTLENVETTANYTTSYIRILTSYLSNCYGCNGLFNEDELIVSVWDNHSYCSKCLDELDEEYTKDGYTYDADNDEVKDNEGNIIGD